MNKISKRQLKIIRRLLTLDRKQNDPTRLSPGLYKLCEEIIASEIYDPFNLEHHLLNNLYQKYKNQL
jgi:hypothetical protein